MIYSALVQPSQQQSKEIATGLQQKSTEKRDRSHRSRMRPRLSLDSGIGASSSLSSMGQQQAPPPPSATYAPTADFFLHFEPDSISPASMLYLLSPPRASNERSDSGRSSTSEAPGTEKRQEGELSFDGVSVDEDSQGFRFQHQPHSIFPPSPTVQKLTQAKDYVESLHQNERAPLLYGKNNVIVQPSMSSTRISGYLSIHKTGTDEDSGLNLKWAPNRAMSVSQGNEDQRPKKQLQKRPRTYSHFSAEDESQLLLNESHICPLDFDDCGGTVILVRSDGVQYPPLTFSTFSQVIAFMQCLETHLAPKGSLTPPTGDVDWDEISEQPKNDSSPVPPSEDSGLLPSPTIKKPAQFCFRLDTMENPAVPKQETGLRFFTSSLRGRSRVKGAPSVENLAASSKSSTPSEILPQVPISALDAFSSTYHIMQHQILSRVFNGWLAYTRSISQIRNRLQNLVYPRYLMPKPPPIDAEPLTAEFWHNIRHSGGKTNRIREVYERIYFGGCDPALRREVWPFLLGYYPWSSNSAEMEEIDRCTRMAYERSVSEWLAAEVIILQQQHGARISAAEAAAALDTQRAAAENAQRAPSSRSQSVSSRQEQTVEETAPPLKEMSEANENSSGSPETTDFEWKADILPPISPKGTHEPRALRADHGIALTAGVHSCIDQTDDDTEDFTLTTTDDDDAIEIAAAANQTRRLSLARAHSCPNTDRQPDNGMESPVRPTRSFAIANDDNSDVDKGSKPPTVPIKWGKERSQNRPSQVPRERKQSRNSRAEISGATYSSEVLEALSVNIQRIDKDVARCDRNYYYFSKGLSTGENSQIVLSEQSTGSLCVASLDMSTNLYRLRTILCTWVWQHMDIGYIQGMCDLLAPLLVVLEDEALTYVCFSQLMLTMLNNFPFASGNAVASVESAASTGILLPYLLEKVSFEWAPNRRYDYTRPKTKQQLLEEIGSYRSLNGRVPNEAVPVPVGSTRINRQFEGLRNLIEVLDPVLAEHMRLNDDNFHLYFYRWLLLDFKREFKYADVFLAWETIWTSTRLVCPDFEIFIAFALIQYYRDIILFYCLDYTDIIRFYNERAEQHDLPRLLIFARDLIYRLQTIISSISPRPGPRMKPLSTEQ
ncbi:hypothetical protein Aperf_G00000032600 [Anoplocephala perfoliata]